MESITHSRLTRSALVDVDAELEAQGLARREGVVAPLGPVAREIVDTPGVGREEPVVAHVPVGGVAKVVRVVEDSQADLLPVDLAGVVAPRCPLAPRLALRQPAVGVGNQACVLGLELLVDSDGESPGLLRISEEDAAVLRRPGDVPVDEAHVARHVPCGDTGPLLEDRGALAAHPVARRDEGAQDRPLGRDLDALVDCARVALHLTPVVLAIDFALSDVHRAVMHMVGGSAIGHANASRAYDREAVGPGDALVDDVAREGRATDGYVYALPRYVSDRDALLPTSGAARFPIDGLGREARGLARPEIVEDQGDRRLAGTAAPAVVHRDRRACGAGELEGLALRKAAAGAEADRAVLAVVVTGGHLDSELPLGIHVSGHVYGSLCGLGGGRENPESRIQKTEDGNGGLHGLRPGGLLHAAEAQGGFRSEVLEVGLDGDTLVVVSPA